MLGQRLRRWPNIIQARIPRLCLMRWSITDQRQVERGFQLQRANGSCHYKLSTLWSRLLSFLARLLILIKKGGLLQLKFGVVGVGVGVNIYLWAR